ncbi:MAG: tetratricopeptide repeat-containing glycosyltransferase family protein [Magnetococcus sp. DMHC-6]
MTETVCDCDMWMAQAQACLQAGDVSTAGRLAAQVLAQSPHNAEAYGVLGLIAKQAGRERLAVDFFEKAVGLDQNHPMYHFHLAALLQLQGRLADAKEHLLQAVQWQPNFAAALVNLGNIYFNEGDLTKAVNYYHTAIQQDPNQGMAYYNLGVIAQEFGRHVDALFFFDAALRLDPQGAGIHMGRAFSLLMTDSYAQGWQEYEWRWQLPDRAPRICPVPRWQGESLVGKRIYLYTEQGFGDALMFARFMIPLRQRGGELFLECKPELLRLLSSSKLADRVVAREPEDDAPPPFEYDYHLPLMSLPFVLQLNHLESFGRVVPYLRPESGLLANWGERLGGGNGLVKVGLSWSGNPEAAVNRCRACQLADFFVLLGMPGVRFYSLQKGQPAQQLTQLPEGHGVEDLSTQLTDFAETAAVLLHLDLLISTDTAIVHLAGGLGCPTWTLLHTASEWRWLQERSDSPWYPNMRLYRQSQPGDWRGVMKRVVRDLAVLVNQRAL